MIVLFAVGWGFVAVKAARSEWQLVPLLLICLVAFWVGASQITNFFGQEFTPGKFTTNPILPDVESIAAGQTLFEENCVSCHGPARRGDGPVALTLNPPPADFGSGHTDIHTDGDLYYWVREGIENTLMPAFGEQLTPEETWHLVNYVRRLAAQAQTGQSP
jgi:mono/diheme cytochrome c family protein